MWLLRALPRAVLCDRVGVHHWGPVRVCNERTVEVGWALMRLADHHRRCVRCGHSTHSVRLVGSTAVV